MSLTMPELGFRDHHYHNNNSNISGGIRRMAPREASPDSVIFSAADSNLSIFSSSASCSVDRCSFASDAHEHDSSSDFLSQNLAVRECRETCSSSGPDLDPNKFKRSVLCRKVEKAKVQKEHSVVETNDEYQALDSARSSFSQALKDCQVRRLRSDAKKLDRRRPASLDLNNTLTNVIMSSSPRFGVINKATVSTRRLDAFPSPGTPNYRPTNVGIQKGWSSERVPSQASASRKNVNNALLPLNNGRTLPSKWEDAERWIFSPVLGDGAVRSSLPQLQRRAKSKSGPLGPSGSGYYSMYSPVVHMFDGGNVGNLVAASPFTTGVIAADTFSIQHDGRHGGLGNFPTRMESCMGRSASIHGCSELLCPLVLPSSQDEKLDIVEDEANNVSHAISRRDMATQMSPDGSPQSSPMGRSSFSPSPSALPIVEFQSFHSSKQDLRDVQIDERVTMTRWSKKHRARNPCLVSGTFDDWKGKALEIRSSNWEVSETAKSISKVQREEARISAWENLQKAKAEAAVRKLEMKLEKKRSSSMDKIMNKLRSAQRKAQQMRSSVVVTQVPEAVRPPKKVIPFCKTCQVVSLSGCFICHFKNSSRFQCSL